METNNWSLEAIQERAANKWSLEGDNQLLNLMKTISKNLEQRCTTSNNNLNRLMLDVDKTKVKLGNTTTKFLDLNNGKFVEHTVMDIDSSLSNIETSSTAENEKPFVPLPKAVEEAVTNGLNMMDRCYEKVLLDLDDSDEDENENGQKHVVCRPKNPYLDRPLPYLIGSKQWNDKWHVGLVESDEEVLSDEEKEEFSQSSEDGDSMSISPPTSNPPTASESDFAVPTPTITHQNDLFHHLSDDAEKTSPLFTSDFQANREKIKVLPTIAQPIQKEVKNELRDKSKPLAEPSVPSTEQPKQSIFVQQKPEKKFLNLFDDEPPLLEDPIRSERKPVNLFLDSDDDDDLVTKLSQKPASIFKDNVASRPTLPVPQTDNIPKVDDSKNLFHDDVDNNNVSVVTKSDNKPITKRNDFGGLFDDEPPDDFFDIIVREKGGNIDNKKTGKPKLETTTVRTVANLFESDDDEDDFSKIIGTSRKDDSLLTPSVEENIIKNTKNDATFVVKNVEKPKVSDETFVVKNVEEPKISHPQSTYSPYNSPFRSTQNTGPPKSYLSFLDDEPPSFAEEKEEKSAAPPKSYLSFLDDEPPNFAEDEEEKSAGALKISTATKGLFDEPTSFSEEAEKIPAAPSEKPTFTKGLFDDSSIFAEDKEVKPVEPLKKPTSSKVLFDDSSIFAENKEVKPVEPLKKPSSTKGLFNEPPRFVEEKPAAPLKSETSVKGLFDDPLREETPIQDTPPNEKRVSPVAATRKLAPKIIYDDIAETLKAKTTLSDESQSTFSKIEESKSDDSHTQDETDQSLSFKKNFQMFSNPDLGKLPIIEKENKPKPNKLKTNFNINVAALLPGAKLPPQKQSSVAKQEEKEEPEPEKREPEPEKREPEPENKEHIQDIQIPKEKISQSRPTATTTNEETTSGRLTCLSKNRAKIKVQRRPSTRTGRQRLYKNTLIADDKNEVDDESLETTDSSKQEIISDPFVEVMPSEDISKSDVQHDDWLNEPTTPLETNSANNDEDEDDWLKTVDEKPPSPSNLREDYDWLSPKAEDTEQKATDKNLSHVMNYDWLTASNLPPEDINPPSSYSIDDYHEQDDDWLSSYVSKEKASVVVDLPSHEDDWLTATVTQEKEQSSEALSAVVKTNELEEEEDWLTSATASKSEEFSGVISSGDSTQKVEDSVPTTSKSETLYKSSDVNLEDDDDDDWFTKSLIPPKGSAKAVQKSSVSEVLSQAPPKIDFKAQSSNIFDSEPPKLDVKAQSSNIFDSEPPKLGVEPQSSRPPTKKSLNSSLFDDDEDDDDLFTSMSKPKPVAKQTSSGKTEAVKATKNDSIKATGKSQVKSSKSLFSDDDDSDPDDLFGSSKLTKKPNSQKSTGEKSKVNSIDKRTGGGLFDDENDDDEDIFSSKAPKQRVNQADRIKKSSVTKLVATIPASNDPLADLLK